MKKNTYIINHNDKTITLTKAYAKLANTPGTKEFRELAELHKAFPDYLIVMRTVSKNEDKEKFADLTVDRMEYFIKCFKDETAMTEFQNAKAFHKETAGYYGKMKKWFLDKYKEEYLNADFSKANSQKKEEQPANAPAEMANEN